MITMKTIFKIKNLLLIAFTLFSFQLFAQITGNGNLITKEFKVKNFNAIKAGGVFHIYYTQGNSTKVEVECDENLMDLISVDVRDGYLVLSNESMSINNDNGLTVKVSCPSIERVKLNGAAEFEMKGNEVLKGEHFDINMNGASSAHIDVRLMDLNVNMNGASHIELGGKAAKAMIDSNGASSVKAQKLRVGDANLISNGASNIVIAEPEQVVKQVNGASSIRIR